MIPRAKRDEIAGVRDGALLVRLAAPPVEGAANSALVELIATWLSVPRRAVRILSGERSRRKRVEVRGASADRVLARIESDG